VLCASREGAKPRRGEEKVTVNSALYGNGSCILAGSGRTRGRGEVAAELLLFGEAHEGPNRVEAAIVTPLQVTRRAYVFLLLFAASREACFSAFCVPRRREAAKRG
jgi:hypothetical protein